MLRVEAQLDGGKLGQAGGGVRGLSEGTLTKRGKSVGTLGEEDPLKSIEKAKCDKKPLK